MAEILDGKALSQRIKDELKSKVNVFKEKYGRDITLAVILVGENPASKIYVKNKIKACEYIGIKSLSFNLPENSTYDDLEKIVKSLSFDKSVDGILVQMPLPKGIDEQKVLSIIPPEKDVDGFTSVNVGNLFLNKKTVISCTPKGIIRLLKDAKIELSGKNAVVIGRSNIVGKPVSLLLLNENCTVTTCHSKTKNISEICRNADIIIAALGKPKFVKEDMIKDGAIIVDVGINRTENGLVGDVDFENVKEKASYISPVPGGVGPMTIAMLMENTLECAINREENGL